MDGTRRPGGSSVKAAPAARMAAAVADRHSNTATAHPASSRGRAWARPKKRSMVVMARASSARVLGRGRARSAGARRTPSGAWVTAAESLWTWMWTKGVVVVVVVVVVVRGSAGGDWMCFDGGGVGESTGPE